MNQFTSPYERPFLSDLKIDRESKINSVINNLKMIDIKDDDAFSKTTNRIKNNILLTPVEFGEPKLDDYEFFEKPLSFEQQLIGGISRNHYIHKISFPFTGNSELLSYKPENGFSYSGSDHGLILPFGNTIIVEVDLPELSPEKAIMVARQYLSMTFQFCNLNNNTVQTWAIVIGQRIEEQMKQKKDELIKIFGAK